MRSRSALLLAALMAVTATTTQSATITIINNDPPGSGFNDPTMAAPVGGNMGATLGQQRLNAFQHAADIWGAKLSSNIEIKIAANFQPLTPCEPTFGVIGSAGPLSVHRNFTNAPLADTWYITALASSLANSDFAAGGASISASFNSNIGTAGCLSSLSWYLGLDGNEGSNGIDLVATLLHEFGHGLGFLSTVDETNGAAISGFIDSFTHHIFDNETGFYWRTMSQAQRAASAVNTGDVVFDGPNAEAATGILNAAAKDVLGRPKLYTPNPVEQGSSVSHFDTSAIPNQLMEPAINADLTHNVDLPNDLSTKVMQDIGWPLLGGSAPDAPTGLVAVASGPNSVGMSWNEVSGATEYRVYRRAAGGSFTLVGTVMHPGTSTNDNTAAANTAYLYMVRAYNGTESPDSNTDLATTVMYLHTVATGELVRAATFTELRTAALAVEALAGTSTGAFTDGTLNSTITIKAAHLNQIKAKMNAALAALGFPQVTFSDVVASVSVIDDAAISEARTRVQ